MRNIEAKIKHVHEITGKNFEEMWDNPKDDDNVVKAEVEK